VANVKNLSIFVCCFCEKCLDKNSNYFLMKTILQYRIVCGNIYPTKQNILEKEVNPGECTI